MSDETTNDVVEEVGSQYDSPVLASETKQEYDELKAEYKATRRKCASREERKTLMRLYVDDLIEIAVQARIAGDVDFNANLNQEIKALNRRIFTGQNNSW